MEELEAVLDPVTAGAVVKTWLKQLEQPIVPFEMFEDFQALARSAKAAPFALARDLKALVDALPRRNLYVNTSRVYLCVCVCVCVTTWSIHSVCTCVCSLSPVRCLCACWCI